FMDMDKMVGGDFERGLASMKSAAESAAKQPVPAATASASAAPAPSAAPVASVSAMPSVSAAPSASK
ncbi:MAG: polyketide cyclase, partial [Polyangiales bacterium]